MHRPIPLDQLDSSIVPGWLKNFLQLNEAAISAQDALGEDAKSRLTNRGQVVLSRIERVVENLRHRFLPIAVV